MHDIIPHVHRARVDAAWRIVLPAPIRARFGLRPGDEVLVESDDRGIHIKTPAQALQEAQDYFARFAEPGVSIVDELLRERRAEAERE